MTNIDVRQRGQSLSRQRTRAVLIIALGAPDARPIGNQHEADYRQHNQQPPTRSINIVQSPNADAETWNEGNQRECVAETRNRHDKGLTLWNKNTSIGKAGMASASIILGEISSH